MKKKKKYNNKYFNYLSKYTTHYNYEIKTFLYCSSGIPRTVDSIIDLN